MNYELRQQRIHGFSTVVMIVFFLFFEDMTGKNIKLIRTHFYQSIMYQISVVASTIQLFLLLSIFVTMFMRFIYIECNIMDVFFEVFIILVILGFGLVIYFLRNLRAHDGKDQAYLMLQNQIHELTKVVEGRLSESARALQQQYGESTRIVRDVTERLTKLDETNRQVINFADQLNRLQDILKNPKQRGVFGEYYLETLLSRAFQPNGYQMQYKFQDGLIVDAVIYFRDKIIPIDSKFSLENYNRIVEEANPQEREKLERLFKQDLKNRIDETSKYIRPQEGTTDFAFMFIPAEGIFYDLLVNKVGAIKVNTRDLIEYAVHEKRVHIVSPTTFYVTLQSMLFGLQEYEIQESTKEIIKNIAVLGQHVRAYEDYFIKIGNNLGTTVNSYNLASKELAKIDKDVVKITGGEQKIESIRIDKPQG